MKHRKKHIYILFIMVFVTIVLTVFSDTVSKSVFKTLELCQRSVIPSLFPFIVLSSIISKTAVDLTTDCNSDKVIFIPFFLGALCGFPVGASSIALIYKNGIISKKKAEYFCALCNNTGPAFIIGIIGKEFWGSSAIGIMFYLCQIISAVICFGAWYIFLGKRAVNFDKEQTSFPILKRNAISTSADYSICTTFCTSVTDAVRSIFYICGYIVFFKVLCDILKIIIFTHASTQLFCTIVSSVLEFTSGAFTSAELGGSLGIALCGFSIGFSGLSVIAQSASFLYSAGLSVLPLLRLKIFIGATCAALSTLLYNFFDFSGAVIETAEPILPQSPLVNISILICIIAFLIKLIPLVQKLIHKSHN